MAPPLRSAHMDHRAPGFSRANGCALDGVSVVWPAWGSGRSLVVDGDRIGPLRSAHPGGPTVGEGYPYPDPVDPPDALGQSAGRVVAQGDHAPPPGQLAFRPDPGRDDQDD